MRFLRSLWKMITGFFNSMANSLQGNIHVMEDTYDRSIEKINAEFNVVRDAVASLINMSNRSILEIKQLNAEVEKLTKIKNGAQTAMQRRIDALTGDGKSKEEIKQDPDFIRHSGNFKDAASSLEQILTQITGNEQELKNNNANIEKYKVKLQEMQKRQIELKKEKVDTIAEVTLARQSQQVADTLSGIGSANNSIDSDLSAAREVRRNAQASLQVTTELFGNDAHEVENEYLELAKNNEVDEKLDSLLNWGTKQG